MSKYDALTKHLATRSDARVPMSFSDLEAVLGFPLPASARTHRPWWANSGHGHVQARGWLDAGYQSEQVDLESEKLVFVRLNEIEAAFHGSYAPHSGDHPLFGCMTGMITISEGADLTEPVFDDDEMRAFLDRKAASLREERP